MKQWSTHLTYLCVVSCLNFSIIQTMQIGTSTQQTNQNTLDKQLRTACLQVTNHKEVETLLEQGANPLAVDSNGNNSFHLLVQAAGRGERENTNRYIPLIKLLFDHNRPSTQQMRNDNAFRDYLIKKLELLKFIYPTDLITIVSQYANHYASSQQNIQGQTPLHIILASPTPNTDLANLFIKAGFVCVNIQDQKGNLPEECPRPLLSPAQIQHYDKTRAEIVEIITRTRNLD